MTEVIPDDEYVVTIVKYGTRRTTRSDVFLNYHLYGEPDGPIEMDYFFWVLRNDSRTIVVDTGFSPRGGESRGRQLLGDVAGLMKAAGADPLSVPVVVLTHGHYDHIGNLGLFPVARFLLSRRECEFWSGDHADKALFHHSVDDQDLSVLSALRADGRVELFEGEATVAPGVTVKEVGGHTPGQSVVTVKTSEGVVLLASDAVHYYEELERDLVFSSVADVVEMYDAFADIRRMAASGGVAHVVSGHDPGTLGRFAPGPRPDLMATIGGRGVRPSAH